MEVAEISPVLSIGSKETHRMRSAESAISQVSNRNAGFLEVANGT